MPTEGGPSTPPRRLEGGFYGVRADGVVGWAWDPEKPHRSLEVELALDGDRLGTTRAELFDPELAAQRLGNGSHAFRFKLNRVPRVPCELFATVRGTDVTFGPLRIETAEQLANAVDPTARYEGYVEGLVRGKGRVQGWVYDRLKPKDRVRVTLRDGNEPLLEVKADIHRAQLEEQGKSDGACAFAMRLPVSVLDGRPHSLRITIEDTDFELPGGPIEFDPAMARELIEIIAPWRADGMRIETTLSRLDQMLDRLESEESRPSLKARVASFLDRTKIAQKFRELRKS